MSVQACIDEIRRRSGAELTENEIDRLLTDVADRAQRLRRRRPELSDREAVNQAAAELTAETRAAAAIQRRNQAMNLVKRQARREFYLSAPAVGRTAGAIVGLEAKLVGVNTPFYGSRLSVDAQWRGLTREWVDGLTADLERAQLFEALRGGTLDREIAQELEQLRLENGRPGVSGSAQARQVAGIVADYMARSRNALNREGAWIGELDGYVVRQSHDPDRLRRAGFDEWRQQIAERLDERTFDGVEDRGRFLRNVYDALVTGVHFKLEHDFAGFKDPAFRGPGNLAERMSASRVLHFTNSDAWLEYHQRFGTGTLSEAILRGLDQAARNVALMRELGTNPRVELEGDIQWLRETRRSDHGLMKQLDTWSNALSNRLNFLDGTARTPVNERLAAIGSGIRAWQSMSKLGGVLLSAFGDIPIKASELRYQGVGLLESYADGLVSVVRGRGRGEEREIADLMRAGLEGARNSLVARFDAADTTPGTLAKIQDRFFQWTGLKYWTDAQRAGAEMVMARWLAQNQAKPWAELPNRLRRVLGMFAIDEGDWRLLADVDLAQADGRRYMTPAAALQIPDAAVAARLADGQPVQITPEQITRYREALGERLRAYFADRSEYAVINPDARVRAIMLQGTQAGTPEGEALRFMAQFKAFPVAIITKAWGREIYGGEAGFGRMAGIAHMIVGSTLMGYLAMSAKDLAKGREPRDPTSAKTWAAAFTQGGGAGLYGDFIVGEYSRFGRSLASSLAGPTLGQVDDVAEIWNRLKKGEDPAGAALRTAVANTPFVNLFYTKPALDYLVLYQLQEAINPGFLRRMERRVERENGQQFILAPSSVVARGGGFQ